MDDPKLETELGQKLSELQQRYEELKSSLNLAGPYDDHDVILIVYAGAGGTDAQDWAQMLLRMYVRWAEAHKYKRVAMIDESAGEEAGLKSATFEISGDFVFGQLQGEHSVRAPFSAPEPL